MFKQLIDRIRRYYVTAILPQSLFEDNNALTMDEKKYFVANILSKPEARRILEKYIRWKYGIHTRNAMRSADDRETLKFKERAFGIGEQTIDFQNIWNEVHRSEEVVKEDEKPEEESFKIFK